MDDTVQMLTVRTDKVIFFFLPVIYILLPSFPSLASGGIISIWFFLLSSIFFLSILKANRIAFDFNSKLIFIYFLSFIFLLLVSLALDVKSNFIAKADLIELPKVACYFLITYGTYLTVKRTSRLNIQLHYLNRAVVFIFIFIFIFNIFDIFDIYGFRHLSFTLYKRETVTILQNKAIAPFSQTYQLGSLMILILVYFFIGSMKLPGNKKVIMFLGFLCALLILLLTQSRSSLLAFIISLSLCILFASSRRTLVQALLFLSTILFFGVLYNNEIYDFLREKLPYMISGIESMVGGSNNSVNYRSEQIYWVIDNSSLIIGMGVSKAHYMFESLYSLYLYRYGVFGLLLFLLLCVLNFVNYYRASFYHKQHDYLLLAISIWFLSYPVTALSSAHQDTPKLALVFYGLTGLGFALNRKVKL